MIWLVLTYSKIHMQYTVTVRNKTDSIPENSETHTPNDVYKNFVTDYIEAATECVQTKTRSMFRVQWKPIAVKEKWDNTKEIQQIHRNLRKPRRN